MSQEKRGFFARAFLLLMIFCALVWIWTVGFIVAWPWDKSDIWKPEFRVVAVCLAVSPTANWRKPRPRGFTRP